MTSFVFLDVMGIFDRESCSPPGRAHIQLYSQDIWGYYKHHESFNGVPLELEITFFVALDVMGIFDEGVMFPPGGAHVQLYSTSISMDKTKFHSLRGINMSVEEHLTRYLDLADSPLDGDQHICPSPRNLQNCSAKHGHVGSLDSE